MNVVVQDIDLDSDEIDHNSVADVVRQLYSSHLLISLILFQVRLRTIDKEQFDYLVHNKDAIEPLYVVVYG